MSLLFILISIAIGNLYQYRGEKVLIEGDTFVNNVLDYDKFSSGYFFKQDNLIPYSIRLDKFSAVYDTNNPHYIGQPIDFLAEFTTHNTPYNIGKQQKKVKVNQPLEIGKTSISLIGNGYAVNLTIKDGNNNIVYSDKVISLPKDNMNTSTVVLKIPDARPEQLSFIGFFLPTAEKTNEGLSFSNFPDLLNPTLTLDSYIGNLNFDNGDQQKIYELDTSNLEQINGRKLSAGSIILKPKETYTLPNNKGSITFNSISRYVSLKINHDPSKGPILFGGICTLVSLFVSLYVPRRKAWVTLDEENNTLTFEFFGHKNDLSLKKEFKILEKQLRMYCEN